jgi:UPF0716 family protein affecting phage T7 exclusion
MALSLIILAMKVGASWAVMLLGLNSKNGHFFVKKGKTYFFIQEKRFL